MHPVVEETMSPGEQIAPKPALALLPAEHFNHMPGRDDGEGAERLARLLS
jgi:hypothetical protein